MVKIRLSPQPGLEEREKHREDINNGISFPRQQIQYARNVDSAAQRSFKHGCLNIWIVIQCFLSFPSQINARIVDMQFACKISHKHIFINDRTTIAANTIFVCEHRPNFRWNSSIGNRINRRIQILSIQKLSPLFFQSTLMERIEFLPYYRRARETLRFLSSLYWKKNERLFSCIVNVLISLTNAENFVDQRRFSLDGDLGMPLVAVFIHSVSCDNVPSSYNIFVVFCSSVGIKHIN